jgi:hypothetical protein
MSNGIIDQIVDQASLDLLLKLQQLLNADAQAMQQLIDKSATLRKELGTATNMAQLNEQLEKQAQLSKEVTAESKKSAQTMSEVDKLRERLVKLSSEEAKQTERLRQAIADKNRELRNAIRQEGEASDSIKSISGRLNLLRQEYEKLGKAQRDSAAGKDMLASITSLDTEYKELRGSMGQFQANVGDYQGAILRATGATEGFTGRLLGAAKMVDFNILKQKAYNAVVGQSTGLIKGLRIAMAGLMAASVVGGIILLIANWGKLKDAVSGATKEQKLNSEVAEKANDTIAESLATYKALQQQWNSLGSSIEAQNKFLKENREQFDKLGVAVNNVSTAERIFNEQSADFVRAIMLRAKASAAIELASEKLKEVFENQQKAEEVRAKGSEGGLAEDLSKATLASINKSSREAEESAESLINTYISFGAEADKIFEALGIATSKWSEKAVDTASIYSSYEADRLKKSLDDDKKSLAERLALYRQYVAIKSGIISKEAQTELAAAKGDEAKVAEVTAKRNVSLKKLTDELNDYQVTESKKLQKKIETAQDELAQLKSKKEVDALARIANSENASYNARMEAAAAYTDERINEANRIADKEIESANGVQELVDLANEKRSQAVDQAERDRTELELKAARSRADKVAQVLEEQVGREVGILSQQQAEEEAALAKKYASGAIKKEQYEQGKLDITNEYALKVFQVEIDLLQATLDNENLTAEQRIAITKKLTDAKVKLAKESSNQEVAVDEKSKRTQEENEKKLADMRKQLINETVNLIKSSITSSMEARIAEYDQQLEQINTEKETRLAALDEMGMSEARRAMEQQRIEEEAAAKTKQIEEEKKQAEMRKARFEKASALFESIINTALSIGASAQMGFPLAIPFIAMAAALGAVQQAAIIAQKPPQYKEGTAFHRGGLAILGDGGVQEGVILPGGSSFASADIPTLYDLPRGTKVLPDIGQLEAPQPAPTSGSVDLERIEKMQAKTIKAIQANKAVLSVNLDARGIWSTVSNNTRKNTAVNGSFYKK